ncbi:hypothetical protein JTB14_035171 [Gonioctena quinquepunctata]|nr:hypothetical protein JTB14_035171 [Gonioctena quinquepunctata]
MANRDAYFDLQLNATSSFARLFAKRRVNFSQNADDPTLPFGDESFMMQQERSVARPRPCPCARRSDVAVSVEIQQKIGK